MKLTMETDVSRWADEERLEEVLLGQLVDVCRDVDPIEKIMSVWKHHKEEFLTFDLV